MAVTQRHQKSRQKNLTDENLKALRDTAAAAWAAEVNTQNPVSPGTETTAQDRVAVANEGVVGSSVAGALPQFEIGVQIQLSYRLPTGSRKEFVGTVTMKKPNGDFVVSFAEQHGCNADEDEVEVLSLKSEHGGGVVRPIKSSAQEFIFVKENDPNARKNNSDKKKKTEREGNMFANNGVGQKEGMKTVAAKKDIKNRKKRTTMKKDKAEPPRTAKNRVPSRSHWHSTKE